MPSFFIRNLARIFALSQMEKSSRSSTSYTLDEVAEGVSAWNKNMRWLIPFVKAADYRIVIENPKYKHWYFGHFHIDRSSRKFKFHALYESWCRV